MDAVRIFHTIRDIPYKIPLSVADTCIDCDQKHKKLAEELSRIGLQVRFRICVFRWSDLDIPDSLIAIPHNDKCEHLYLEVMINDRWIILDATWDYPLRNILPVNEWDGVSDTELAIKPLLILEPDENRELSHNETEESFLEDIKTSGDFYAAFNKWTEENRI